MPSMRPPLEECEAAGAISSSGATFSVIDSPALKLSEEDVLKRVLTFNPDLIVLSITFGSQEADLGWACRIRAKLPQVPIGLRGAPCYVNPQQLLNNNQAIDFCLRGDYEVVLRSIIEFGLFQAAGVVSRKSNGDIFDGGVALVEDLDQLPFPDRSGINPRLYTVRGTRNVQATIRVQRGCPFPCTYCLVHTVSGNRARHRSPLNIVSEMKQLRSQGVKFFYLRAETFSLDRKWALSLLDEITQECPGVFWVTTTRAECVDDELLAAMKKAGCYGISFGLDVASNEIAAQVKKPLKKAEARRAVELCRKHGIVSLAYIMIGFIWDTNETLKEAKQFIKDVSPDLLTVHYAHPYPGTVYYDQVKASNALERVVSLKAQAEPALAVGQLGVGEIRGFGRGLLKAQRWRIARYWSLGKNFAKLYLQGVRGNFINSSYLH